MSDSLTTIAFFDQFLQDQDKYGGILFQGSVLLIRSVNFIKRRKNIFSDNYTHLTAKLYPTLKSFPTMTGPFCPRC